MKSASTPSAKRPAAKRSSSSMQSTTDWAKLKSGGSVTATPDHPDAEVRHIVCRGLKPQPPKAAVSLRIEQDVLEWFKAQGTGYQTRINSVLRAFRDASV